MKNEKIVDILKSQAKKVEQEDEFHQRMETAEDKFSVISEYMGLGVFRSKDILIPEEKRRDPAVRHMSDQSGSSLNTGPGAEARMRSAMVPASRVMLQEPSEARLRGVESTRYSSSQLHSEGRLRANMGSEAEAGRPTSDARMRQKEGRTQQ